MTEPVVMAHGPASSHIGRSPCGDSWIHRFVISLMPLCYYEGVMTHNWSLPTPEVGGDR